MSNLDDPELYAVVVRSLLERAHPNDDGCESGSESRDGAVRGTASRSGPRATEIKGVLPLRSDPDAESEDHHMIRKRAAASTAERGSNGSFDAGRATGFDGGSA